jgi:poly-D-alanine transfer protein DltD
MIITSVTLYEGDRADKTIYTRVFPICTIETQCDIKPILEHIKLRNFNEFANAIGFRESSNNYLSINQYGYLGKYQFGKAALKDVKINNRKEFLNNPNIQDKAFLSLCKINKYRLRKHIVKYVGTTINGIKITESGIIASAHLVGAGSVKKYLRSNGKKIKKDTNNTSLEEYLELFKHYDLNIKEMKKV